MRQMTWEDWNPYRGMEPRYILAVLAICFFLSLAYEGVRRIRQRKTPGGGRGFWIGFVLFYVYTILCATMFGRTDGREPEVRTRLFWTLEAALQTGDWIYWYYIVGNILMFLPLGFALAHLLNDRTGRAGRSAGADRGGRTGNSASRGSWCSLLGVVFLCLLFSAVIEGIQYVTGTGLCEADDLLHNAIGGGIGGAVYLVLCQNTSTSLRAYKQGDSNI